MAGEFKDVRVFWATTSAGQFALALVLFVENLDQIGNEDGLESLHANGTRHRCQSLFPHELQKKKKKNTQKVHVVLFLHTLCLPHLALSRVQGGDSVRLCMSVNSCLCGAAWWSEWPSDRPTQDSHVHFFFFGLFF